VVVLQAAAVAPTPSRSTRQYAKGPIGSEGPRGRSARPEQQRCAARLREQTRPLRRRRCRSCRRRSGVGTAWSPDAGIPGACRRDTRPGTTGWRFGPRQASARSKKERLETRDTRHSYGQDPRRPERQGSQKLRTSFKRSPAPNGGICGFWPGGAENSSVTLHSLLPSGLSWDRNWESLRALY
jgi:hypothetical protein